MLDSGERIRHEVVLSSAMTDKRVSVVTPTFHRPAELLDLLDNLAEQILMPAEVIIVDGSADDESQTALQKKTAVTSYPFELRYIRYGGGTADQRNRGIEDANGDYIALVDDDVRLDSKFLSEMISIFESDSKEEIGGIAGFKMNQYFTLESHSRWKWYRRLGLLKSFDAGRYDYETGYPINNNMLLPFSGTRAVDFMTTACAVWRRSVFESGLRFDPFFKDFGVLEDAHFSLRAGKRWKLIQCGDARCTELSAPGGRVSREKIGYKCVVNYYYVFNQIAGPLRLSKKFRFWRFQAFELFRIGASAIRRRDSGDAREVIGRLKGIVGVIRGAAEPV